MESGGLGDRLNESKKENVKSRMTCRNGWRCGKKYRRGKCFIRGRVGNESSFRYSFFLSIFIMNFLPLYGFVSLFLWGII